MKDLDGLRALTEERERFNERTRELHAARGVPSNVPLVFHPGDTELEEYAAWGTDLVERENAFWAKEKGEDGRSLS